MPLDPAANFVRDTTTASIDNSATTLAVEDAGMFPDPSTEGEYNIVVWDASQYPRPDQDPNVEICRVTATDATNDELTVTRAQEDTAAAGHPSGSSAQVTATAKMFSDIEGTFADFWDDSAQELTADVNNQLVQAVDARLANDQYTIPVGSNRTITTVSDAIDAIPGMGSFNANAPTIVISLAEGETFSLASDVYLKHPWAVVQIEGEGAGATIELPSASNGIITLATELRVENVTMQPADTMNPQDRSIRAGQGARVDVRANTTITGASVREIHGQAGCKVTVRDGATVSGGSSADVGIWVHSGSHLELNGTVEDYPTGAQIDRSSSMDAINSTFTDNTVHVTLEDGSSGKIEGSSASVTGGGTAMVVGSGAYGRIDASVTLTSVSEFELDRTYAGGMYERQNGALVIGLSDGTIQSGGNSLFFRDDAGTTQMRHDLDTGDLVLAGALTENGSP